MIGAPRAGRSSLLQAIATLLEREGIEHGAIESEELTRGFPPLGNVLAGIDLTVDTDAHEAEDLALTILAAMRERELL